jgi:nucleoside 2-deoxyribosyltransferase
MIERMYFAGRFERREELQRLAVRLERMGYTITSRWLCREGPEVELVEESEVQGMIDEDLEDLRRADTVVAFTDNPGAGYGRGGRHVEFGFALALGKRLIRVGPVEHMFHLDGSVRHFKDGREFEVAMRAMRHLQWVEASRKGGRGDCEA